MIEVLSPSTRRTDEHAKRQLLERGGVHEYWLVDPDANSLTVYRRAADGAFRIACGRSAGSHDVLTTPLPPAFALRLGDLFA